MKKLALVFLAGLSLATAKAQIQFGVKAGANFANLRVSPSQDGFSLSNKIDFNGGVLVNIPLVSKLSLQPEVVYSGQGSKFSESGFDGKYNFAYVNIPVLVKYKIAAGFFAETGPQFGILASAKVKEGSTSTDVKSSVKSTDFAWALGVGYNLPFNLGIDVRYNLGLSNISKDNTDNETLKNGILQAGVFYLFGGGKK